LASFSSPGKKCKAISAPSLANAIATARPIPESAPQKLAALQTVGENQFHYLNLYTVGLVKLNGEIYSSEEELLKGLATYMKSDEVVQ